MPNFEAVVFDMDGTILDTFPDLARCANGALVQMGFPTRTDRELRDAMGYGGRYLIEQAVPPEATAEQRASTFELWRSLYIASDYALTAPFPGIITMLVELRIRGMKTAVLSNKFHEGVCVLADRFFLGLLDVARGDKPPVPRKPDPTSLLQVLEELNVRPDAAVYVGDGNVDVETARNAGVKAIGVSWGYDCANPLRVEELDAYVRDSDALLQVLCDDNFSVG